MNRNHETSFKDPVCGMEVSRTTAIDEFTYLGKAYYFCAGKRSKQNRKSILIGTVSMGLNRSSPKTELNTINCMRQALIESIHSILPLNCYKGSSDDTKKIHSMVSGGSWYCTGYGVI